MHRTLGLFLLGVTGLLSTLPTGCGGEEFGGTGGAGGLPSPSGTSTSTGGAATGTGGTGAMPDAECATADECPGEDTECRKRTCEGGVCAVADTPTDTPAASQIEGDCKIKVCDGKGTPKFGDDDTDLPPSDDNACTDGVCSRGVPLYVPTAPGTMCPIGVCDGAAKCVECLGEGDCTGGEICQLHECVPATCDDGIKSGDETDTDCGGSCAGCANSLDCNDGDDCQSGFCDSGTCKPCQLDVECPTAQFCATGVCLDDLGIGQPCDGNGQCTSGSCADGVCCNTPCNQGCSACSIAKKGQGNEGMCGPIGGGLDPDDECTASDPSTCGFDGECNGMGACRKWLVGTLCAVSCDNLKIGLDEKECNGAGQCLFAQQVSCMGYLCNSGVCGTDCNGGAADCAPGYWCNESSVIPACEPKKPDGATCEAADECITNGCCFPVGPTGPMAGFGTCDHCCNGIQDMGEMGIDCGQACANKPCAGGN